ncbi:MAG TPA: lysylphosphatidylglycerol synthase transmembrane domain-containing protein [Candidatus Binatia bacterium]|nr:lysylphosphatidylglycerol synthase transmembrane domain-containing protein [Candidatus Binatia bacterium]
MPRRRLTSLLRWLPGTAILAGLAVFALRKVEWAHFSEIVQRAEPAWLVAAVLMQLGTYLCAAATLQRGIKASGVSRNLFGLVPLGLAKLFVDQVVPTGGLGGTVLVVRALERRGVKRGVATAAVVVNTLAFYASYAVAVGGTLAVLWLRHGISRAILVLLTLFGVYAVAMPVLILWIVYGGRRSHPKWLAKIPGLEKAISAMEDAPTSTLRHPMLFLESILLQLGIIVLDAWTLDALLRSIGHPAPFLILFTSFVLASIAATLSLLPGGVGSFEAGSVASMRYLGVPLEVALTGTLLFRGLTLWLPMLPGIWFARHEMMGEVETSGGDEPGREEPKREAARGRQRRTAAAKRR